MNIVIGPKNTTICAVSRLSRTQFVETSLLGRSLRSIPGDQLPRIALLVDNGAPNPVTGLSAAYNSFLKSAGNDDFLIFIHDDVFIHDWFLLERLAEAFVHFDVVGVAGNRALDLAQPSWALKFNADLSPAGWQDRTKLSGSVGHGDPTAPPVSRYGDAPAACDALDGLFLAVNVRRLRESKVQFDPRFRFNCYDLDFCRTAIKAGLRVGTWPIALTHASVGNFASQAWKDEAATYLKKWG
jgi:hypothetical protein